MSYKILNNRLVMYSVLSTFTMTTANQNRKKTKPLMKILNIIILLLLYSGKKNSRYLALRSCLVCKTISVQDQGDFRKNLLDQ